MLTRSEPESKTSKVLQICPDIKDLLGAILRFTYNSGNRFTLSTAVGVSVLARLDGACTVCQCQSVQVVGQIQKRLLVTCNDADFRSHLYLTDHPALKLPTLSFPPPAQRLGVFFQTIVPDLTSSSSDSIALIAAPKIIAPLIIGPALL